MRRSVWVDANNDPAYTKIAKNGITDIFFDALDPRVTKPYLDAVKSKSYAPGLYLCSQGPGWPMQHDKVTGRVFADWAYDTVERIAQGDKSIKVHLNCESSDPDWLVTMLKRWRAHSPKRDTALLIEGRKAGIFNDSHVRAINKTGVWICPEFFTGDMTAHPEGFVTLPMIRRGFNPATLYGCYDAANLPYDWVGVAFTQGRLA